MKEEFDKFKAHLLARGLKVTRTRKLIFEEIISGALGHPNASEIHARLKAKGLQVSLATIYRTLDLLVKSGLVSEVDLGENHSHYEADLVKTSHGHLICLGCGKVKEFSHREIKRAVERIGRETDFQLDKFSIQVFGFCGECQKRKAG